LTSSPPGKKADESVRNQLVIISCELESVLYAKLIMDSVPHFMYFQRCLPQERGKTMTLIRSMNVEPAILSKTQCDMKYGCLSGKPVCNNVEPYIDRDVQLLRCKDERSCAFKKNYQGLIICTCPVNRASFSIT
jgi:hypothetical protein